MARPVVSISDLDETMKKLLVRELPIKNSEVDVKFDQPKRDWSARVSKPTLNIFLHDIRENNVLRQPEWEFERNDDGSVSKRRSPVRLDLHYMITAWVADNPEDEHKLLTHTLMALFRNPIIPDELLEEPLQDQPFPIPIKVAQQDEYRTPADVWNALDNELRPAIVCTLTLSINPYAEITGPLVRSRDLRFGQAAELPRKHSLDETAGHDRFWMVGGEVQSKDPLEEGRVTLVERGQTILLQEGRRFIIGNLETGDYTLELWDDGRKLATHKITVPSENYDIKLST